MSNTGPCESGARPAEPGAGSATEIWRSNEWRDDATRWIDETLAGAPEEAEPARGGATDPGAATTGPAIDRDAPALISRPALRRTGPATQPHLRPWSTVLRVPVGDRELWLKSMVPPLAYEPTLIAFLAKLDPDLLPEIIAVSDEHRWMLLCDIGTSLRSRVSSLADLRLWRPVLARYAALQRAAAGRRGELLATGIPDRRAEAVEREWNGLIAAAALSPADDDTRAACLRASHMLPELRALFRELAGCGLPDTVEHGDLHDNNVFFPVRREAGAAGRYAGAGGRDSGAHGDESFVIADWGDASFANPLCTLTVLLRSMASRRSVETDAPPIVALRDVYLEQWSDLQPMAALREAAAIAVRVGTVLRALSWRAALSEASASERQQYGDAVPGWLAELAATTSGPPAAG